MHLRRPLPTINRDQHLGPAFLGFDPLLGDVGRQNDVMEKGGELLLDADREWRDKRSASWIGRRAVNMRRKGLEEDARLYHEANLDIGAHLAGVLRGEQDRDSRRENFNAFLTSVYAGAAKAFPPGSRTDIYLLDPDNPDVLKLHPVPPQPARVWGRTRGAAAPPEVRKGEPGIARELFARMEAPPEEGRSYRLLRDIPYQADEATAAHYGGFGSAGEFQIAEEVDGCHTPFGVICAAFPRRGAFYAQDLRPLQLWALQTTIAIGGLARHTQDG